jgi:hypothetical protein
MTHKHLVERAVILGAAKRQHLVAVAFVPPGSRALEPHMTDELVGRLNSPAAQWIAPFAQLAIGGPMPMLIEIDPNGIKLSSNCLLFQLFT